MKEKLSKNFLKRKQIWDTVTPLTYTAYDPTLEENLTMKVPGF